MTKIFLKLGFVSPNGKKTDEESIGEIWKVIGGDSEGQNEIPLSSCKNFLKAIQNFHHQDIIDPQRSGPEIDMKKLGRATVNGLLFKPNEIEFITKRYLDLYANRQDKLAYDKQLERQERQQMRNFKLQQQGIEVEPAYRPQTSKVSSKIVARKRNSHFTGYQIVPKIEDRLISSAKDINKKKEELRRQTEKERSRLSPFKPKVSPFKRMGP